MQATEPPEIQQERLQAGWKPFVCVEVELKTAHHGKNALKVAEPVRHAS